MTAAALLPQTDQCAKRLAASAASLAPRVPALNTDLCCCRPLDAGEMRGVLRRLALLDAPWNCPHGRPTMRHVCVLPDDCQ